MWSDKNLKPVALLSTAGGRIQCLRCTARSTRTKLQCARPALKDSRTKKCQFHGGRSTGPKTAIGKANSAAAHTISGQFTKTAMAQRSQSTTQLLQLEDALHILGMTTAARTRGRKSLGYRPLTELSDIRKIF
jgi:hypothetical protein